MPNLPSTLNVPTTDNLELYTPAFNARDWHAMMDHMIARLEGQRPLYALGLSIPTALRPGAIPPGTPALTIRVGGGVVNLGTALFDYAGAASVALTASSVNYLYLDDTGTLVVNTSGYPAAPALHIRIGRVTTGVSAVTSWIDDRVPFVVGGASPYVPLAGGTMTGLLTLSANPSTNLQAATKQYVDSLVVGVSNDAKESVRVASTANVALTGGSTLTIDGVAIANGNRVLLKDQSTGSQNGIYTVAGIGTAYTLTRATDADTSAEMSAGVFVFTNEGTANADKMFVLTTNDPITLGSTALTFTQITGLATPYVPLAGGTMTGLLTLSGNPVGALDAATKQYVDAFAVGLDPKGSVRAASTANVALTGGATLAIDGISLANGDRVLLKDQTTAYQNGIYTVGGIGTAYVLTRAGDADTSAKVTAGMYCFVTEGTVSADKGYLLTTNDPITLDSTGLTFTLFTSTGGGVTDHGALTGLADDDHAQYALLAGRSGQTINTEFVIYAPVAAPGSPTSGHDWHDSTQLARRARLAGVNQAFLGVVFTATADASVSNANGITETTIAGTGIGTKTLPANFFAPGKTVRVTVRGFVTCPDTRTLRIKVKLGSTVVADTTAIAMAGTINNHAFEVECLITCRTTGGSGTVYAQGRFWYDESTHAGTSWGMPNTATVTIDTTASQVVDVTATWGTAIAGNVITGTNVTIEVLN